MPAPRDSPLEFTRAERVFAIALVLAGLVGWTTAAWLPIALGPGEPLAALDGEERAAFAAEVAAWTARLDAAADSAAAARAARDSAYAARRATYAARDRERAARRARRSGDGAAARVGERPTAPPPPAHSVDPNRADSATLRRTGLPAAVVSRLLTYRAKAGGFRESDDLARLYDLDAATFARARAYLLDGPLARDGDAPARPRVPEPHDERLPNAELPTPTPVDLNDASEADLTAIRGIGPFYARQILDYRDRLGGFVAVAQVAETPRLRAGAFAAWADRLTVGDDARPLAPLHVNRLDARALARHPYLPYRKAAALVAYRGHHGPYRGEGDVYAVGALDSALVGRLAPYLSYAE